MDKKLVERVTCGKCGEAKVRIHQGFFNPKSKIYTDDHGKYWSGRTCPACKLVQVRKSMAKLRQKKTEQ